MLRNMAVQSGAVKAAHADALDRCWGAFVLLLTSVGIPMFLAGEELGDVHDPDPNEDAKKSGLLDWRRLDIPGHN